MRYDPYLEAEYRNIYVHETSLDVADGFYRRSSKGAVALINSCLTEAGKRCALTHELMHDEYSVGITTRAKTFLEKLYRAKHERFVDRKATEKLIPEQELVDFLTKNPKAAIWDIADYFSVTERYVRIRLESPELKQKLSATVANME